MISKYKTGKHFELTIADTSLTVARLRQHRAVATRYDKRDFIWRETIDVASIRIWLRHPVS